MEKKLRNSREIAYRDKGSNLGSDISLDISLEIDLDANSGNCMSTGGYISDQHLDVGSDLDDCLGINYG